jgi:hypothetical protein
MPVKRVYVYESRGRWIYEIWINDHPKVIGCAMSKEMAEREAAIA